MAVFDSGDMRGVGRESPGRVGARGLKSVYARVLCVGTALVREISLTESTLSPCSVESNLVGAVPRGTEAPEDQ